MCRRGVGLAGFGVELLGRGGLERGWQQYCDMKAERDSLRDSLSAVQADHALAVDQLAGARKALQDISNQRDWYMRRCVELETQFTTFGSMVAEAMQKRVSRPHLPMTSDDGAPVPQFLTEGLKELANQQVTNGAGHK